MDRKYLIQAQDYVKEFINSGMKHMSGIPGNRVYMSDITASTIAWAKGNVVIEYYMLFPNIPKPAMHSHPFANQMIFISGDLKAYRTNEAGETICGEFNDSHRGKISSVVVPPFKHGFETGPKGAIFYNIQIWDQLVRNPTSATVVYEGMPLGPSHAEDMKERENDV